MGTLGLVVARMFLSFRGAFLFRLTSARDSCLDIVRTSSSTAVVVATGLESLLFMEGFGSGGSGSIDTGRVFRNDSNGLGTWGTCGGDTTVA